jgi:hypothetical protein
MSEIITPAETLHEDITDLVEGSECGLFEVIGVLDVVKAELILAGLAADEDEDEADGVVGE